jgi:ParB-like nuclease domain
MNFVEPNLQATIKQAFDSAEDKEQFVYELRGWIWALLSPHRDQPIDNVRWIDVDKIQANDYNPNSVATNEMRLLYVSIQHDGYTQPIVTVYDPDIDKYVIVDGFHRYSILRSHPDIYEINGGKLPVVVIQKGINDRMASTIRHNRARGKHSVAGMGQIVFNMLKNGASDAEICNEVGLEPEELARLKYVTGFAKLFANVEYSKSWETVRQTKIRKDYQEGDK